MASLETSRVLVVGGSSGIGRAIGVRVAKEGAKVALAARRADVLAQAVEEAGSGAFAVECDVRDPNRCQALVDEVATALGGLDVLVYTPAYLPLMLVEDATAEDWRVTLETNLVGASLVTRAALPYLKDADGRVLFISSDTVTVPRSGLGLYAVSKIGLGSLCEQFRLEVPTVRFSLLTLGPLENDESEITHQWDVGRWSELEQYWPRQGVNYLGAMRTTDVAEIVVALLRSPVRVENALIEPPSGGLSAGYAAPPTAWSAE